MGLMDKLKNALFEEEYVEVEEKPKKPKKSINKIKEEKRVSEVKVTSYDDEEEKPIAKKIVSEKKEEVFETPKKEEFTFPAIDDDFFNDVVEEKKEETKFDFPYEEEKEEEIKPLYKTNKEEEYVKKYTSSEYGNYEKAKEKKIFRPSPNISPVYGIIDDNGETLKGEPRREIRLNSAVRSEKVDVDDIRRKAFGLRSEEVKTEPVEEEIEEETSIDLTTEDVPKVNKVTMGDAEEYFEDLGLEYNTDYIDAKKEKATGRRVSESYDEEEKLNIEDEKEDDDFKLPVYDKVEEEKETTDNDNLDDDNLFDLIDSMYDK